MSDLDHATQESNVQEERLTRRFGGAVVAMWPDLNRYLKDKTTLETARELDGTAADQAAD